MFAAQTPRIVGTVETILREVSADAFVQRRHDQTDDGLPEVAPSGWQCAVRAGPAAEALRT